MLSKPHLSSGTLVYLQVVHSLESSHRSNKSFQPTIPSPEGTTLIRCPRRIFFWRVNNYYSLDSAVSSWWVRHYQGCTNSRFAIRIYMCVYGRTWSIIVARARI